MVAAEIIDFKAGVMRLADLSEGYVDEGVQPEGLCGVEI